MHTFVLAGGCFWCLDAVFRQLRGVVSVVSGYTGGVTEAPTYPQVCTGTTGHAEAVECVFDPELLDDEVVLDVFFTMHDPTQLNRQGNDIGTQYRSAMFYADRRQHELFAAARERAQQWWEAPLATTLEPLGVFHPAEDYHQDYYALNPEQGYCRVITRPKVLKIRQKFSSHLVR